jgi:hypothetical protein
MSPPPGMGVKGENGGCRAQMKGKGKRNIKKEIGGTETPSNSRAAIERSRHRLSVNITSDLASRNPFVCDNLKKAVETL